MAASESDRLRRGRAVYARNFGVDEQTAQQIMVDRAGATYAAEAYEAAGGPGWHGDGLTDRDRSVAIVAAFVASNLIDERLQVCLNLARANGIDEDGLTELMVLLTAYVGQPAPSAAMVLIQRMRGDGR